ncbi:protein-disulfide reductase DsbD [Pseudomonas mangiferae]|uniref:Thiol:disulfide interchange protein DsbD n=1 Tax=Pseudomonas mangiferae TaxID=2593654 RepID=A0A553GWS6_9PSED|nr:protein-disulfide reductase DsbD [Pseudomonas mangiferae]TRX73944.1 protein-disulfide reductase DsbD [Pseudomonas mangiferae]
MRRLLILLLLLITLPASAGFFDQRPAAGPLGGGSLGAPLNNSDDFLPVREAFRLRLSGSSAESIKLSFITAEGYYLYRHRFQFRTEPADIGLGEPRLPDGLHKRDDYFGDVEVYYGILDLELPLKQAPREPYTLVVTYQGCADKGLCYPPETERIRIGEAQPDSTSASASSSAVAPGATPATPGWSWHELALFFLAGLGLTFTPCVLPMLPILSGVVLRGRVGGTRGLALSLAYVLPMAACFAVLGALMGVFGAELNLQARLQSPWILVPFAAFFAVFALAMFGLFELRLPRLISEPLDRLAGRTEGGSLWGAALLGVLSSLLVSPCVSAPLAGALLYISTSGDALGGGLKLFLLGLGMGAPLVLFAAGGGALLPKTGTWMVEVRNAFGVLLLAVTLWLLERVLPGPLALALWGLLAAGVALFLGALEFVPKPPRLRLAQVAGLALLVYAVAAWTGALQGRSDPLRPLGAATASAGAPASTATADGWRTVSEPAALQAALDEARAAGQPLLLDWYADWCISCKVIEREVFEAPEVLARLGGYRLLRFDITRSDPAQRAVLDRYGLFGPPAIQFFDEKGDERSDLRVVGEIDAAAFVARLEQAAARR